MSLSVNNKDQIGKPLFYGTQFDHQDLKVKLESNLNVAECTFADMVVSGFMRREIRQIHDVPMLIVQITSEFLNSSPHLPEMMALLIPMTNIFNQRLMDLKTPKFSNLSVSARTALRLFLQWRLNMKTNIIGSPKSVISDMILSGNDKHFGYEGCFWLKQVLPYHPELTVLRINNNNIRDEHIPLLIQALSTRHDPESVQKHVPIKLLEIIDLSNNQLTDKKIYDLLQCLLVYTPYVQEINLSQNILTKRCCNAIAVYLDEIDAKPKKQRCLKRLLLRRNEIDFEGAMEINDSVVDCSTSWKFKIELGSNPTNQRYVFDENQRVQLDHRINLHGT